MALHAPSWDGLAIAKVDAVLREASFLHERIAKPELVEELERSAPECGRSAVDRHRRLVVALNHGRGAAEADELGGYEQADGTTSDDESIRVLDVVGLGAIGLCSIRTAAAASAGRGHC